MRIRTILLSLCACSLLSAADQVVLKNGDVITGTVIKKDGDKLTLKSEFLGEVTMPWSAVKSLKSDQELNVVLPGGETVRGKVSTSGENLAVAAPAGEKAEPLTAVTVVRSDAQQQDWQKLQHPGIFQLWNGTYNLGLALARGNARTATLSNSFAASRITTKDKILIHFNELYATARINNVDSATASALSGGWEYDRNFNPKWFVAVTNEYDHDRFQDLTLRAVFGGGLGWNAVKTPKAQLSFQAGGDYNRENFDNAPNRNSAEAIFGNDLVYKVSGSTSFTESFRVYPNLSDTGSYRFIVNLSAVTALKKWLGWHITFTDNYFSDPVLGRLPNDIILSTGFQLGFGPK